MKQPTKQFKVGNKVFAKVKGYPAWPARIDEDQGKNKYKVHFYGTGEMGVVKAEDLFLYSEYKEQFVKNLKRKDYNDALEEIETAIKEEGGDDPPAISNSNDSKEDNQPKRGIKRKQSLDNSLSENEHKTKKIAPAKTENKKNTPQSNKKKATSPLSHGKTNSKKSTPSPKKLKDDNSLDNSNKKNNNTESIKSNEKKGTNRKKLNTSDAMEESMEVENNLESEEDAKYLVVSSDQLQKTIEECSKILMKMDVNEEIDSIPEELTPLESKAILLARVDYGKYIGIKINNNRPIHFKNGVERLQWAVDNSQRVLDLKEKIELGIMNPEDQPELFELDVELTKDQLENEQDFRIVEHNQIKVSLGLDRAEPEKALRHLDDMLELTIDPLMLKKHPHVVDMVKRLRRYFGNIKEWKLKEKELNEFKKQAEEIRKKAESVYQKFQSLFEIPENKSFTEVFQQHVQKFKSLTKNMTESQVFALCAEPGSKQALWDELDDQEEIKLMSEKLDNMETSKDKENMSENANFEADSQSQTNEIET